MRLEFTHVAEDYIEKQKALSPPPTPANRFTMILLIACVFWMAFQGWQNLGKDLTLSLVEIVGAFLALSCFWFVPKLQRFILRSHFKRVSAKDPKKVGPFVVDMGADGLTWTTKGSRQAMSWGAFISYKECSSIFLLFSSLHSVDILPKRAIGSEANLQEVRSILERQIGSIHPNMRSHPEPQRSSSGQ